MPVSAPPLISVALLTFLLMPGSAVAAAPAQKQQVQEKAWAIILASKPQRAEAEAQLAAMQKDRAFTWARPAEGYPQVIESSSLPGLTPGLQVLLLGVCGTKQEAQAARARVLPMVDQAYVKQLTGPAALACPQPIPVTSWLPGNANLLATVPFEKEKSLVLTVHRVRQRKVMECETSDLRVRLSHGKDLLAEQFFEGTCQGACTASEKKEGQRQLDAIRKRIASGDGDESELDANFVDCQSLTPALKSALGTPGRPLLFIETKSLGGHDVVMGNLTSVTVGCGQLQVMDSLNEGLNLDVLGLSFDGVEARPLGQGSEAWKQLELLPKQAPGSTPAARKPVATGTWNGCAWDIEIKT
ncbi:hypothetical protein A176_005416 [Myxococcus hansupus]|uniref:Lipoprotein n=1 Tax=Pseudomyxococcus hansupus TaxID=1297742 RepID=A0A0H4X0A0_9BACT|nr:hypothetical protein [Myxococcus hansupus]AKQ68504.1 hypothetical protein A176_005416 [Myxococcus hansupus]